jgi:hypothetical protein
MTIVTQSPQLYYLWNEKDGEKRHGMKPVTLERARKVMVKANQRNDGRIYWFEPAPEEEVHNFAWLREIHPGDCECKLPDEHCPVCDARAAEVYA